MKKKITMTSRRTTDVLESIHGEVRDCLKGPVMTKEKQDFVKVLLDEYRYLVLGAMKAASINLKRHHGR